MKGRIIFFGFVSSLMMVYSCKNEVYDTTPDTSNPVCDTIDYVKHIQPIFEANCNSCHQSGGTAPGDFTKLENIQAQKDRIKVRAVIEGTMPPGGPMSDQDRNLLGAWIDCGAVGTEPVIPPSYATEVSPIFTKYCTACHSVRGGAPGDFNLYDDIKIVADNGKLNNRVFVVQDMPQGDSLSLNEATILRDWLEAGAPNN